MQRILLLLWLVTSLSCPACPWCGGKEVTPTVIATQQNAGGLFFGKVPPEAKTKHYFIAAEPLLWDWVPGGKNVIRNVPLPPFLVANPRVGRIHYVEYTDATFSTKVLAPEHLGLVGPVIRGLTGEYLAVTFWNKTDKPLSMHPHGVRYDKDSEGAYYLPGPGLGSAVGPGAKYTYVWHLDEASGPQAGEPSSKCWLYHSHCKNEEEVDEGLVGMIVVTDPTRARPDGTPNDVDREFVNVYQIQQVENEALEEVLESGGKPPTFVESLEGEASGARHGINGRMFGSLAGLNMKEGERVRWYLASIGDENGLHTAHWHGARLREDGKRFADVVALLPGETKVADMLADNPGNWLIHCHVGDHMMEGMFAPFRVLPKDSPESSSLVSGSPFFSQPSRFATLRWQSASGFLDFTEGAAKPVEIALKGEVPVFSGFYLKNAAISISFGGSKRDLTYSGSGNLAGDGIAMRVLNANGRDVVLDSKLVFEISLQGTSWLKVFDVETLPSTLRIGPSQKDSSQKLKVKREGTKAEISLSE